MFNGVNINYLVITLVTGAVLLAAIYHTILFMHRRTRLLAYYSTYLWFTFTYICFRFAYPTDVGHRILLEFLNPDETLQMLAFAAYIRFMGVALDLDPVKEKVASFFAFKTKYLVLAYVLIQILIEDNSSVPHLYLILKISMRVYLLILGLYLLVSVMRVRKKKYYYYLAAAAISLIFFGGISSISNLTAQPDIFILSALSWLVTGFFFDVVFFSAAIGYRIKIDALEKENAMKMVMDQQVILRQNEIDKLRVVYDTREEERSRIAQDLHDDIGSTLSGIALYSHLALQQLKDIKTNAVMLSLDTIQKTASQMVNKLNDIIWTVSPSNDNMNAFLKKLEEFGSGISMAKNIYFQAHNSEDFGQIQLNMEQRKNLYLICKEAINNAVKYSACTCIDLLAHHSHGQIEFCVSDNGRGFNINEINRGNGISNIYKRAKEISGLVEIKSAVGKGTSLRVICKIT